MREELDALMKQSLPGERQWLRSALLTDHDGILTETRRRLARLARARGVEPQAIDDVVQETFLEAWSHLDRLYAPTGFHAWIDEICRNICRRAVHKHTMNQLRSVPNTSDTPFWQASSRDTYWSGEEAKDIFSDMAAPDDDDPFEELSRQDMEQLLDKALGTLSQASRQLVEMCYLLELPRPEVAARLGISSGALETRLHRIRRQLRHILNGPLRKEAEGLGFALDETVVEGWQDTRLWCPLCASHRLQGLFVHVEAEGPNLHLRCPSCSQQYGQDTVHSMGLVSLAGLRAFRPAWKRTMQGLTDLMMQSLAQGLHPCLYCRKPAFVSVEGGEDGTIFPAGPYPFWIHMQCTHCGRAVDASGDVPSIDQLVYWSHPLTRQFVQQHPRWQSTPGRWVESAGESAIHFQLSTVEGNDCLTVVVHRQTLRILTLF